MALYSAFIDVDSGRRGSQRNMLVPPDAWTRPFYEEGILTLSDQIHWRSFMQNS